MDKEFKSRIEDPGILDPDIKNEFFDVVRQDGVDQEELLTHIGLYRPELENDLRKCLAEGQSLLN